MAPQGRRRVRDRLRLPPDHRRRRRRVAEGDAVPHRARGRDELQALHGLPGRVLQRRRPDPARDADGERVRRDDHDARRERHRDRRARSPRRSPGARPTRATTPTRGPPTLEAEATHRAIVLAKVAGNVPLYVVHMSAGDALEEIAAARHAGRNVFAETCPQYLWLTLEETLARPGFEGAKWVCSTPLRSPNDEHHHQADLWRGLRMNELGGREHRPLPVLLQGPEGAGRRRLLQDPERHRRASSTAWSCSTRAS